MAMNAQDLRTLGWRPAFQRQLTLEEEQALIPVRVASHFGSQILCLSDSGEFALPTALIQVCGEVAVGDWLLLEPDSRRGVRRLERESLVARRAAGEKVQRQLIAANLDTLFIVTSCNHDFNLARLERHLALAAEAAVEPVVILTKSDLCDDPLPLRQQAMRLKSGLIVEAIDARDPAQVDLLADWCGVGKTVALVGSSGVGKSTLAMTLGVGTLATQEIREDDSRGRHTTTARHLHRLDAGGLLIDTPGMRELQLADCESGLAEVFDDVVALADLCRFRNCSHDTEPGCAVREAIECGELDERRLTSFLKLQSEEARNSKTLHERRQDSRKLGQFYKSVMAAKRQRKTGED